jgi:hypothetical protein
MDLRISERPYIRYQFTAIIEACYLQLKVGSALAANQYIVRHLDISTTRLADWQIRGIEIKTRPFWTA